MIINVWEIGDNGLKFNLKQKSDWFNNLVTLDENDGLVRINSDIELNLVLFKVVREINVTGSVEFGIVSSCSLCLDKVEQFIKIDINLILSPLESLNEEDFNEDHETYSGDNLDLNSYFREQISLSLPFKVVCNKECRGLCPKCGENLNLKDCCCSSKWEDQRFSVLKGIKV
ncbi:MAG: YceD family protein [Thermodesulfobacteriota bacterium]